MRETEEEISCLSVFVAECLKDDKHFGNFSFLPLAHPHTHGGRECLMTIQPPAWGCEQREGEEEGEFFMSHFPNNDFMGFFRDNIMRFTQWNTYHGVPLLLCVQQSLNHTSTAGRRGGVTEQTVCYLMAVPEIRGT